MSTMAITWVRMLPGINWDAEPSHFIDVVVERSSHLETVPLMPPPPSAWTSHSEDRPTSVCLRGRPTLLG
jgi:hypothetical protein